MHDFTAQLDAGLVAEVTATDSRIDDLGDGKIGFGSRLLPALWTLPEGTPGRCSQRLGGTYMWAGGAWHQVIDEYARATESLNTLTFEACDIQDRLRLAEVVRRGAMADLGALMRHVEEHNNAFPDMRANVRSLAATAGVSAPTAYKAREEYLPGTTTSALARAALDAGLGTGSGYEVMLTHHRPRLIGLRRLVDWMYLDGPLAAWEAAHPGEEWDDEPLDPMPGYQEVAGFYRRAVERIAAGGDTGL